jgi:hypothetical protein
MGAKIGRAMVMRNNAGAAHDPFDSRTLGLVLLYEETEVAGAVRVSWLQIGCPFCPSEVNLPAAMADMEVTCDGCGKAYLVPTPESPVLAAAGPLAPLAILRTPGLAGNSSGGIAPIPHLPPPVTSAGPEPVAAGRPKRHPSKPQLGGGVPGGARFPWEMSPEARASAAAIFGAEEIPGDDQDDLEAVTRRLRKEQLRAYARWMMIGVGMLALSALAAFFLSR